MNRDVDQGPVYLRHNQRADLVVPAPDGVRPHREVAFVSVMLEDGREARFHVSVHLTRDGGVSVEVETKRMYQGRTVRSAVKLGAKDYRDPDSGEPSATVRCALSAEGVVTEPKPGA